MYYKCNMNCLVTGEESFPEVCSLFLSVLEYQEADSATEDQDGQTDNKANHNAVLKCDGGDDEHPEDCNEQDQVPPVIDAGWSSRSSSILQNNFWQRGLMYPSVRQGTNHRQEIAPSPRCGIQ